MGLPTRRHDRFCDLVSSVSSVSQEKKWSRRSYLSAHHIFCFYKSKIFQLIFEEGLPAAAETPAIELDMPATSNVPPINISKRVAREELSNEDRLLGYWHDIEGWSPTAQAKRDQYTKLVEWVESKRIQTLLD